MSTIETTAETVFDAEPSPRLGPESSGRMMTPEEFQAIDEWQDGYRYELVHGVVIETPSPGPGERGPNDELGYLLRNYGETHPEGGALDGTLFEQELTTPSGIRRADRVIWTGLGRTPDPARDVPSIVVEFVSASRRDHRRDYEEKRREYAAVGVREYWIIDRHRQTLTVCRGPEGHTLIRKADTYRTDLLPGFELPLARLLEVARKWEQ